MTENNTELTKPAASPNAPQPDPIPNSGRPVWPLVIESIEREAETRYRDLPPDDQSRMRRAHALLAADMRERDAIGRAKYGTPLCLNDGRSGLVDAYQEVLDAIVYLFKAAVEAKGGADSDLIGRLLDLAMILRAAIEEVTP